MHYNDDNHTTKKIVRPNGEELLPENLNPAHKVNYYFGALYPQKISFFELKSTQRNTCKLADGANLAQRSFQIAKETMV